MIRDVVLWAVLILGGAHAAAACGPVNLRPVPPNGGVVVRPGTSWSLCSGYRVAFQTDGNLIVYNRQDTAVWGTNTYGHHATALVMQPDGNLVIYAGAMALWDARTFNHPGAFLAIQEDGNVVIYGPDRQPLWATYTNGR
jgi:hypothetical protein